MVSISFICFDYKYYLFKKCITFSKTKIKYPVIKYICYEFNVKKLYFSFLYDNLISEYEKRIVNTSTDCDQLKSKKKSNESSGLKKTHTHRFRYFCQ